MNHPLFRNYTVDELHRSTKYSYAYLVKILNQQEPARPGFRLRCSLALGVPENKLFLEPVPERSPS